MPFAFPSHVGLIAPLWRRWPGIFDMPALCIGAMMPDVVDGAIGITRGHLGQTWGHTLLGMTFLCVPFGVPLWMGLHRWVARARLKAGEGFWARSWNHGVVSVRAAAGRGWGVVLWSLLVGAFSHLFFDLLSHGEKHGGFKWLRPLDVHVDLFPAWWNHEWFRMPVPGYQNGYAFAPHFIAWCAFSLLGAWMLIRPLLRGEDQATRPE